MTHMTRSRIYPSKELALLLLKFTEKSPEPEKIVHRTVIQEIENEPFQSTNIVTAHLLQDPQSQTRVSAVEMFQEDTTDFRVIFNQIEKTSKSPTTVENSAASDPASPFARSW